jgi:hypothetical protein
MSRTSWIRRKALGSMAVAVVAAALVGVVGCGNSDDESAGGSASTTSSSGSAAQGKPVKVSVISIVNNPAFSSPGVFAGAKAAADTINKSGGVGLDHHPIEVVTCDNELNPNKGNECARKAVSAGVVADVGSVDAFTPATTPIFHAAGIQRILNPVNPGDATTPGAYAVVSGGNGRLLGVGPVLASKGITKAVWVEPAQNIPTNVNLVKRGFAGAGVTFVGRIKMPANVSDYAPFAKQVKNFTDKGAQGVFSNAPGLFQLIKAYNQLGGKSQWYSLGTDSKTIKAAGSVANGVFVIDQLPPPTATSIPAVKNWVAQLSDAQKRGVNGADQDDSGTFTSWLSVYALKTLLANTKGDITNKTVTDLLAKTQDVDVEGLVRWSPASTGPTDFPRMTIGDVWLNEIDDGKVVQASDKPIDVFDSVK